MIKDVEKVVELLVGFLRAKVKEAGLSGCVVGVSGGVDSSVVCLLCKRAFPETTYPVYIGIESSADSRRRVEELTEKFHLKTLYFDLTDVYRTIRDRVLEHYPELSGRKKELVLASLKSCLRAPLLDFLAKINDSLIVGTGNRSEAMVGYFNKRGDGAVDIALIRDLYKSEVYQLAKYLGVPESIIKAVPSADLWSGQTDEEELGITYDELEKMLERLDTPPDDEREYRQWRRVYSLHARNRHKLQPPPSPELRRFSHLFL